MTLFHFGNCVALAYAPYVITYKYSGISEYSSIWKCVQAGVGYLVTQLCKLLFLATVFPTSETEGEHFDLVSEFLKSTVDIVDLLGLFFVITKGLGGKGEVKFLAGGLGWASAELLSSKLIPLWFGAKGLEFDWKYIQMSLEANLNLVHYMAVAFLVWTWARPDLSKALHPFITGLLVYAAYRNLLFELFHHYLGIQSWPLLFLKAFISICFGIASLNIYNGLRTTRENSH